MGEKCRCRSSADEVDACQLVNDPELTHALQVMRTAEGMRITVGELADGLSMTRRTLERRFRDLVGTSPASEQRRLRIERACVLLTEGGLPIQAIARELGFAYANHFSTAFIATMRISPTTYRAARATALMQYFGNRAIDTPRLPHTCVRRPYRRRR
ncbi:MAG TPA: helix-turn-helix transcriptional regulator [Tepidisphaeraceae bacterium]|jgi:transcriptional regulator GlxA family with amidase domain|nr:helix-turn-helix transcriptional regulator [Tepidisphaeraceae bacterium]